MLTFQERLLHGVSNVVDTISGLK